MLLLCWRDVGHPQGGGSETYLQRIGAQLAASGVKVTLRTARCFATAGSGSGTRGSTSMSSTVIAGMTPSSAWCQHNHI